MDEREARRRFGEARVARLATVGQDASPHLVPIVFALDDAAIPSEPRLRFELIAWFTWATAMLNHRWTSPDDVPSDLPLPLWGWGGTEGW